MNKEYYALTHYLTDIEYNICARGTGKTTKCINIFKDQIDNNIYTFFLTKDRDYVRTILNKKYHQYVAKPSFLLNTRSIIKDVANCIIIDDYFLFEEYQKKQLYLEMQFYLKQDGKIIIYTSLNDYIVYDQLTKTILNYYKNINHIDLLCHPNTKIIIHPQISGTEFEGPEITNDVFSF